MAKGTFLGGIHPPESKSGTASLPVERALSPARVVLPLRLGVRARLEPVVSKGDAVLMGQIVADSEHPWGTPVHSPVSGKVSSIGPVRIHTGQEVIAIAIESDGQDTLAPTVQAVEDYESLPEQEIRAIIRSAGIVGMGGGEFPAHVKLAPPEGQSVDTLILNGAECEPYLTCDHRLMIEKPEAIVGGARILMKALGVNEAVVVVEDNKPDAFDTLARAASDALGVRVEMVKTKYPQGYEKMLIKSVLGREVPPGALPCCVGVVVHNVGTAAAVYDRFRRGMPLIERIVTISGEAMARPANLLARLGTLASELIDQCGGFKENPGMIIFGGPMTGFAVSKPDIPIGKGICGVVALTRAQALYTEPMACIKCGRCIENCPMHLEPARLHIYCQQGMLDKAEAFYAMDCMECGICSYVCPSRRQITQAIKVAKCEIAERRMRVRERGDVK